MSGSLDQKSVTPGFVHHGLLFQSDFPAFRPALAFKSVFHMLQRMFPVDHGIFIAGTILVIALHEKEIVFVFDHETDQIYSLLKIFRIRPGGHAAESTAGLFFQIKIR